jgi:hypothetical protein
LVVSHLKCASAFWHNETTELAFGRTKPPGLHRAAADSACQSARRHAY